jgi:hypothetical protein
MSDAINTQNRLRNTGVSGDTKAGSTAKTKIFLKLTRPA